MAGEPNHQPFITHFTHSHPLELCNLDLPHNQTHHPPPPSSSCSVCSLPQSSGYIYTCQTCPNFFLHLSCSQLLQYITHPSHPNHPLFITPTSNYPSGQFICDACNIQSVGSSYHCSSCRFDLHIKCAIKPLIKNHHLHLHPLHLTFAPPYGDGSAFSCNVCRHVGTSHWLYRCAACGFDVHLDCPVAPGRQTPTPLIHQQSLPNYYPQPQHHAGIFQHSASLGVLQSQRPPVQSWQPQAANQSFGNMVMQGAVQGFVAGAAQQVGHSVVQGFFPNDGGAGHNYNGGGDQLHYENAAGDNYNGGGDQLDYENY